MSYKQKVLALLRQFGATVEDTGYTLHFDAPTGYVWAGDGLHCLSHPYATNGGSWKTEAWQDAHSRIKDGIRPCPERAAGRVCEVCDDDEEYDRMQDAEGKTASALDGFAKAHGIS